MEKDTSTLILTKLLYFATIFLAILTVHAFLDIDNYVWVIFLVGMIVCDVLKEAISEL